MVDHLEECHLFSDFDYSFRSSRSTADLLTVASDRIARAFNRSEATQAVAIDISQAFDRVWHHDFCLPSPFPTPIIMGGLNLEICQNFVGTKFFLRFVGG